MSIEKYKFNSLIIGLKHTDKKSIEYINITDGVIDEEFYTMLKKNITDGSFYSLGANYDNDTKYIDIECEKGCYVFGYFNMEDNESLTLLNEKYVGDTTQISLGSGYASKCFINTNMNLLYDAIVHFLKTGEKFNGGIWKNEI